MNPTPKPVLLMVSSMRGGGSERQVLLLSRELDRDRFQPHLYLTEAAGDFLSLVPDDVPVHSFDLAGPSKGIYFPGKELGRQVRYLEQVIERNQIKAIYDRTFQMTLIAAPAAPGLRRVSTIVSPPHLAVPLVEQRFVALKRRRLSRAYRRSSAVVAVSQQAALSATDYYGLEPGTVEVIPNPVDPGLLSVGNRSSGQANRNHLRLVCVGRMTEEKGHQDLIAAVGRVVKRWPDGVPPLKIELVGDGPLRERLESAVGNLGLGSQFSFVGAVHSAAEAIASADALVLPSRFEGMPNVVLEAMSLRTPVIATRAGGTIELERDQPTAFWAEPGNPVSLADAMLEFASHPERARDHVDAASELIRDEHDLGRVVSRIEDLLDPPGASSES